MYKNALETGNYLHRSPVGEPGGGVRAPGTLRYSNIWDRLLGPRDVRSLSVGTVWNFSIDQGPQDLVSEHGAQKACLKS